MSCRVRVWALGHKIESVTSRIQREKAVGAFRHVVKLLILVVSRLVHRPLSFYVCFPHDCPPMLPDRKRGPFPAPRRWPG
jgi:hypothetical protein